MKSTDVFPGTSLKAEDLGGAEPIVTIAKVTIQAFDDGTRKPLVWFVGKSKNLVCNKTNFQAIVDITGLEDTDDWTGHRIKLVVAMVDFQGKRVPAIRVAAPGRKAAPVVAPVVVAPDDSDIPF
jgi:hypothetical protein